MLKKAFAVSVGEVLYICARGIGSADEYKDAFTLLGGDIDERLNALYSTIRGYSDGVWASQVIHIDEGGVGQQSVGVDYYDDSIATTPESALLGLNSFDKPPIIILGGKDKGVEFDALLTSCVNKAYGVICLGQTRQKLFEKLLKLRGSAKQPHLLEVETLEQAVKEAAALAKPSQAVLLSPGCASYDMFTNFDHRGRRFAQIVRALP